MIDVKALLVNIVRRGALSLNALGLNQIGDTAFDFTQEVDDIREEQS